jgi:putative restriction endonuclease
MATNYDLTNGLILRADVHTLFDLNLIYIDDSYSVVLDARLDGTEYASLKGKKKALPNERNQWPSKEALRQRLRS